MDVKDIIDLMSQTSIGIDESTVATRKIYLKYLNLYHFELYNKVVKVNPFIETNEIFRVEEDLNLLLKKDGSKLRYNNNFVDIKNIIFIKIRNGLFGELLPFYIKDNCVFIDKPIGFFKKNYSWVKLNCTPCAKMLEENTKQEDIPYPANYQQVLIYGANYHMYQNEGGMRSTSQMQFNMVKCKDLESKLITYFYDMSNKKEENIEYRGL